MPLPPTCPCCRLCRGCVCDPNKCVDLIVFGGTPLPCLPTGVRFPMAPLGQPGRDTPIMCPGQWYKTCERGPAPLLCPGSFFPYRPPICCDCGPGSVPECSTIRCGYYSILDGFGHNSCDPTIQLSCAGVGYPPDQSYFLRLLLSCASNSFPGGLLTSQSSLVECDPFQVTFTQFTQEIGANPFTGFCGTVPFPTPPTSIIIVRGV